jgi:hypothetical protein
MDTVNPTDYLKATCARYLELLDCTCDAPDPDGYATNRHLIKMLRELPDLPYGKACRWLGFVQGVMYMRGFIDVDEERQQTRVTLRKADSVDIELIRRAVAHASRHVPKKRPLWDKVAHMMAMGKTRAADLCVRLKLNPDQEGPIL